MQISRIRATWPFQALADEIRFRVCRLLVATGQDVIAGTLARVLGIPSSHLSKHLQILEAAGLVSMVKAGRFRRARASTSNGVNDSIFAAVLSSDDTEAVFSGDLARYLACFAQDVE